MIDTKKLRQKILDLAIRGKLVPQDPNDEPASVLLERIRAEKERLIAEGKIKRPKKSKASSAASHYQQFEIPDTWKWTTLEELIILISGQDFPSDKYSSTPKGVPYIIGASNIQNGKVVVTRWTESPTVLSEKNDLLIICKGAGIGKMGINQIGTSHIARQLQALRPFSCYVSLEYIRVALMNGIEIICSQANGLIPGLSRDLLLKFPIPLPPLAEQMKIVNRVASALDNINVLEMEAAAAQDYISLLKSKILDLAMQGKLVPQNPNDEPAADMLRRINPKAKIITDNPHSWNIPNNWCWTRIKDVFKPMEKAIPFGSEFLYIDIDSVDNRTNSVSPKQIKTECAPSRASRKTQRGDIVFSMVRPYLRNVAVVPTDGCIASTGFYILSASSAIYPPFAFRLALSDFFVSGLNSYMKGDNSPSINKSNIEDFVIPLPPFDEQKRIISEIDNIYLLVDSIKASL